ncbi:MAG TPA: indolepyruvate ferredoxin oxidoreductase [Desulfobacterales bacterium]|nr:indolepyruvate ferredoxin oxidoreductase [Desulfobacterales bacterium]
MTKKKDVQFLLGNEVIAHSALEAGVKFVAGYPGTPSSEIINTIVGYADETDVYVEWSVNEKVACEGAAAAAFAGLKSLASMKNAGLSVALDFLTHLSMTGLGANGGSMVVVVCDDPDGHSSGDETDSRWLARFSYAPLLEPSTIAEANDLVKWAYELSNEFDCHVMLRSYTRLSHASNPIELGKIQKKEVEARTDNNSSISPYLARPKHAAVLKRLARIKERFEASSFNRYEGPEPADVVIICSGSGYQCAWDAVESLGVENSVGILKLATLWPFPSNLVTKFLTQTERVLIAEEVDPVIEVYVKAALTDARLSNKNVFGRESGHIPDYGEITPNRVIAALAQILEIPYEKSLEADQRKLSEEIDQLLISRGLAWCPGCPHRATFWTLEKAMKRDGRNAYLTGDIGCYTLDVFPGGKKQQNLLHAMGSGAGLASGLGQLRRFGYKQPVVAMCGDSTFFHSSIPALINAVTNKSNYIQVVLDNQVTAMTGFQNNPGTGFNALGQKTPRIDIETLCQSLGCEVTVADPFNVRESIRTVQNLLKDDTGVRVLIMRRPCELVRMRLEKTKPYAITVDNDSCRGEECQICTSQFQCPGLTWDPETGKAAILDEICSGCGVCTDICPFGTIQKEREVS